MRFILFSSFFQMIIMERLHAESKNGGVTIDNPKADLEKLEDGDERLDVRDDDFNNEMAAANRLDTFSISLLYRPSFAVSNFKDDASSPSLNGGEFRIETIDESNWQYGILVAWSDFVEDEVSDLKYRNKLTLSGKNIQKTMVQQIPFYSRYYYTISRRNRLDLFAGLALWCGYCGK